MSHSLKFSEEDNNGNAPVIIQCPNCQTKFSIESRALEASALPKFHCSRCDAVFSQSDKPRSNVTSEPPPAPRRPNLQSLKSGRQLEIPKQIDSTFRAQAPLERENDSAQLNLFAGLQLGNAPTASLSQTPVTPPSRPSAPKANDAIHVDSIGPIRNAPLSDDPLPSIPREKMKIVVPTVTAPAEAPEMVTFGWKAIAFPITGFFGILMVLSIYTFMSIDFGENLKNSFLPAAPSRAPNELFIRSAKVRKVTLDNGDTVQVISGAVVNRSESPMRDVKIEAALFDDAGKSVGDTRVDSAGTLAKARIKSMTPEMIMENQTMKPSKRSVIQPGESREFAIALFGKSARIAKHFAVRVYSARSI